MLLEHQQQWNVTCDAEQSKADSGNSSFLNVCVILKSRLRILTQHMIGNVSGSYFLILHTLLVNFTL